MSLLLRVRNALAIESGEERPVGLMMAIGILVGLVRTLVYTAGFGLFLETYEASVLAYVYIAVAFVAGTVSVLYLRASARMSFSRLTFLNVTGTAFVTAVLWGGMNTPFKGWVLLALPVWNEMVYVLTTLTYWNLAGRVFNARQGKRLFGLLGTGDRLAEAGIGLLTPLLVAWIGTPALLVLGAFVMLASWVPIRLVLPPDAMADASSSDSGETVGGGKSWRALCNRYTVILAVQVALTWLGYYALDMVFYDRVETGFRDADSMASFLGVFFGVLGAVGLFGQTFLTPRLLSRLGVRGSILVLPLVLLAFTLATGLTGTWIRSDVVPLVLVCAARFLGGALMGITDAPATLMLYQPVPLAQRTRMQGFIDGVVYPVAIGLAGVVLMALQKLLGFGFLELMWSLLVIVAVWAWTAERLGAAYPAQIRQSLARRILDDRDVGSVDAAALGSLRQSLGGHDVRQVLYAIEMLSRVAPVDLAREVRNLLTHPDPKVIQAALREIARHRFAQVSEFVRNMARTHEDRAVRQAALRTLCAIDDSGLELVEEWLASDDPELRSTAIVATLQYGGIRQILRAGPHILALENSCENEDRIALADLVAESGTRTYYHPLLSLLTAPDPRVWAHAARAAAIVRHPRLIPLLARNLTRPGRLAPASDALRAYGADLVAWVASDAPVHEGLDDEQLAGVLRVLGRIREAGVPPVLVPYLAHASHELRAASVSALYVHGGLVATPTDKWFLAIAGSLASRCWRVLRARRVLSGRPECRHLCRCLDDERQLVWDGLFDLLGLLREREAIRRCRHSLKFGADAEQALALESLEIAVPATVRGLALAVLDPTMDEETRLARLGEWAEEGRAAPDELLMDIIASPARWPLAWTRACALLALSQQADGAIREALAKCAGDPAASVRLHARLIGRRLGLALAPSAEDDVQNPTETTAMLPIEKAAVLRSTEIFADTADYVLAHLAEIAAEVVVTPNEVFIREGALEDCMYVIVDGDVEVLVGNRVVSHLKPGDVVGEMQVIDPAPRSATVRATRETMLFRIRREALETAMADRPEIARAINRMLVRRLRLTQKQLGA